MKKRKALIAGVLGLVVVIIAGAAIASSRDTGRVVRTETVARRDLVASITASGVVQPKRKVEISADISGRVIQLAVEDGQMVERGALLLRIDPTSYEAAVRRAEAMVAQAQAQAAQARANLLQAQNAAARSERLARGEGLIPEQELEQARTQAQVAEAQYEAARFGVQQAQASLTESREALRKTTIVAPMSGRVTRVNIEEGETAIVGTMNNPGSLLITIADLSVMEVSVRVDETDVPFLALGDSAVLRIDAFPKREFTGRVTEIANSAVNPAGNAAAQAQAQGQSVDYEVVVTLDDPPEVLRPDLSATAEIVTDVRTAALSVPIIAVTVRDSAGRRFEAGSDAAAEESDEVEGVFVARNGQAEFVPVQVGIAGERYFEVVAGLEGGEPVIAGPYSVVRELEDGDAVTIEGDPQPAAPVENGGGAEAGALEEPGS